MSFSVIIPSKSAANLVPCIKAIREAGETCRIIVVDDGALVDACEDEEFLMDMRVTGATGVKPFVFSRNINIGIRAAGEDDCILLNDDALLTTKYGFTWLEAHQHHAHGYGIISAACNTTGNPNQYPRAGRFGIAIRDEPRTVCFICVYIPRTTINAVGLLDEQFIGYGMEDDDYCLRVRNAGLKLGIFDDCFVDHGSLTSSFRGGPTTGGDFTPNMRLFIDKWGTDNWGRSRSTSDFAHLWPAEAKQF